MTTRRTESWHQEVVEIRSRLYGSRWDSMLFDVKRRMIDLNRLFSSSSGGELHRHIVVSLIAVLQTFHRGTIISIVESDEKYKNRAAQSINEKFSMLDALLWLTEKSASFGEFAAHLSPCNSVKDMMSTLGALLDIDMKKALSEAKDPYARRNGISSAAPLVEDVDKLLGDLAEAFRLRHILAHEAAANLAVGIEKTEKLWASVSAWIGAIESILWSTAYINKPLTQYEMNVHAGQLLRQKRETLARLLLVARKWAAEADKSKWFWANHKTWMMASREWTRGTYGNLDGSMWPSLAAFDAASSLQARTDQLDAWLKSQNPESDNWAEEWTREEGVERLAEATLVKN